MYFTIGYLAKTVIKLCEKDFKKKELHSFDQQFLSRICKFLLKKLKQKKIVKENQIKKDFY